MAVQSPRPNSCLFGDVVQARICARPGERLLGDLQNAFAIPLRVRAGLSAVRWGTFLGHPQYLKKTCNRRRSPIILCIAETVSVLCRPWPLVNRHFLKRVGGRRKTWRRHSELHQPQKMFCPVSIYTVSESW